MQTPSTCPVCQGRGVVPAGFYSTTTGQGTTSTMIPEQCRSCEGSGIVWSGNSEASFPHYVVPKTTVGTAQVWEG